MSVTQTFPFTTPSNYTYGSLVDISGGQGLLEISTTPSGMTFYAGYANSIDGDYGDGDLAGTATGGADVSGGYLDLAYGDTRFISYNADLNADSQQIGCLEVIIKPNYSGSPADAQHLFLITRDNALNYNLIRVYHFTDGNIYLEMRDSAGIAVISTSLGAWAPTSGTDYLFSLNWDITSGATRLFIDGTQLGSTQTDTFTRSDLIALLRVGANFSGGGSSNFQAKKLAVFNAVQHTTNYSPTDYVLYSTTNPTIEINTSWRLDAIESFTETSTKTGSDQIKYVLKKGSSWYYWTGSAWAVSDETYAQANTAAEIETNKASFTVGESTTFKAKLFLHSENGTTTPSVDELVIVYDYAGETPDTIDTCIVWGYNYLPDGTADTNTVTATLLKKIVRYKTNSTIRQYTVNDTPDSSGYWELELIESDNMTGTSSYIFTIGQEEYSRLVPDTSTANFWNLSEG